MESLTKERAIELPARDLGTDSGGVQKPARFEYFG
jgi:hypothetical protein